MSPAAKKKRRQRFYMTSEKQLAQKDKSRLHLRSFRLEMTIDEKNKKIEMEGRQKKRERNSMSPEEEDEMHVTARNNIKKLRLVMSPDKKQK